VLKLTLLSMLLLLKGPTLRVRAREAIAPRPRQLFGLLRTLWKGAAILAFSRSPSEASFAFGTKEHSIYRAHTNRF
jgi:hypothetical protein